MPMGGGEAGRRGGGEAGGGKEAPVPFTASHRGLLESLSASPLPRFRAHSGLLASVHRLVASRTANTAARSALSLISAVPLSRRASRPPSPCTATKANSRSNPSTILAPSSARLESLSSRSSTLTAALAAASTRLRGVSAASSSAVSVWPRYERVTAIEIRWGRLLGPALRFSNNTVRWRI